MGDTLLREQVTNIYEAIGNSLEGACDNVWTIMEHSPTDCYGFDPLHIEFHNST